MSAAGRALVLVTGASRGIGLSIASSVPFPARVVDLSRGGPPPHTGIEHLAVDLADAAGWARATEEIALIVAEEQAERTVLVHAAGTLVPIGFAGEVDGDDYRRNVLLNSAAGQIIGDAFLRAVRTVPGEHDLIMITSGAASTAYAGWSAYGAGKAALDHWVRTVAEEQGIRGSVRVAAIAPGVVDTAMQDLIRTTAEKDFPAIARFRSLREDGALADAEDVARRFWEVVADGLTSGAIIDLRRM